MHLRLTTILLTLVLLAATALATPAYSKEEPEPMLDRGIRYGMTKKELLARPGVRQISPAKLYEEDITFAGKKWDLWYELSPEQTLRKVALVYLGMDAAAAGYYSSVVAVLDGELFYLSDLKEGQPLTHLLKKLSADEQAERIISRNLIADSGGSLVCVEKLDYVARLFLMASSIRGMLLKKIQQLTRAVTFKALSTEGKRPPGIKLSFLVIAAPPEQK